jgi:hypothetical protein
MMRRGRKTANDLDDERRRRRTTASPFTVVDFSPMAPDRSSSRVHRRFGVVQRRATVTR